MSGGEPSSIKQFVLCDTVSPACLYVGLIVFNFYKGGKFMYHALYRKWRPLSFDDVVSQPHITTTLKNQIQNNKIAHAYLFTGSRGTGKTTCARIFAKSVNCANSKGGNPCLECKICKSADSESLIDIIEIDAASNTGVDDIRALKESAEFLPEQCRYKVYIIDEVHMLSINAFNALLKIMEEPPAHVIFILATTEVHKVPATIISRCQRFDFRRIRTEDIVSRLEFIAAQENIKLDNDAATLIAKISDGGMRDALSLLDQCIAYSDNVDLKAVSDAAGIAGRDYLFNIIDGIFAKDITGAMETIASLYDMAKDMTRLCNELLEQMRNLMLIKAVPGNDTVMCLPDEYKRLEAIANKTDMGNILEKIEVLSECNENLAKATSKRIELEMCMVKLCANSVNVTPGYSNISSTSINHNSSIKSVPEKSTAEAAQKAYRNIEAPPVNQEPPQESIQPAISDQTIDVPKKKITSKDFAPLDCWDEVVERFRNDCPSAVGFLTESKAFIYENMILIIVKNDFYLNMFKRQISDVNKVITDFFGRKFTVSVKAMDTSGNASENSETENRPEDKESSSIDRLIDKAKSSNIDFEIK